MVGYNLDWVALFFGLVSIGWPDASLTLDKEVDLIATLRVAIKSTSSQLCHGNVIG